MHKYSFITLLLFTSILLSCKKQIDPRPEEISTNYIPLNVGQRFIYSQKFISSGDDSTVFRTDTITKYQEKDSSINKGIYSKFLISYNYHYSDISLIRKSDKNYLKVSDNDFEADTFEYVFMKENVKIGDTWTNYGRNNQILNTYKVLDVKSNYIINGIAYSKVAIVNKDVPLGSFRQRKSIHYYASGVGEIYSYLRYPDSGFYCNVEYTLIRKF